MFARKLCLQGSALLFILALLSGASVIAKEISWVSLIGGHTKGAIGRDSAIRVVFNRDVVAADLVGKAATDILQVTPAVTGTANFTSTRAITLVPDKPMTSGKRYQVNVQPGALQGVPADAKAFAFGFQVVPLEFDVRIGTLTADSKDPDKMTLSGELLASDRVSPDAVKKLLSASLQGKKLALDWAFGERGKSHRFTIDSIQRESFATDIALAWNGNAIGVASKGEQEVAVPALNNFRLLNASVVHGKSTNPYIQVVFSDLLDGGGNLKGLVQLTETQYDNEFKEYKVSAEGNLLKIFPNESLAGEYKVVLNPGIKSESGKAITEKQTASVEFDQAKPQIRFVNAGTILPDSGTLQVPFEARAVHSVDISAFEIYPDNIASFLQVNGLDGEEEIGRVGRYLWKKTLDLNAANKQRWNRYSVDVTELMKKHPGSLLRLEMEVNRRHSAYPCLSQGKLPAMTPAQNDEDQGVQETSGWDGISDWVQDPWDNYNWRERNNPCGDTYYLDNPGSVKASNNFIASNIGLLAKQDAQGTLRVIATDLRTAEPLEGVDLEIRNYQGQTLAKGTSDANGFNSMAPKKTPFLLVASKDNDTAYLKLNAQTVLSVSHFDVGGKKLENGLKATIYGERGVWRPGDDMYLTFALFDKDSKVPANHPVTMQLVDPRGRVAATKTSTESVGGLYPFVFKTAEADPTGTWLARASLGGSRFSKNLSVETVRPNRLKLELDFGGEVLYSSDGAPEGKLSSRWLHGATADNLKADVAVRFSSKPTKFTRFSDYSFDDPARSFSGADSQILEGRLDKEGQLQFKKDFAPKGKSPGMLRARFTSRVFESGGAFSISQQAMDYHPYDNYIGVKLPKGDAVRGMLLTDTKHTVQLGSLSSKGEPVSMDKVQVSLYKINWKWWWDKSSESLAQYADSKSTAKLQESVVDTKDGSGSWEFEIKHPDWGRYLVRACDMNGKHCSGKVVYIDWPGWAGRAQEEGSGAASRLNLFTDKTAYVVGETATVQLPPASEGRALLTVETGSDILEQRWIEFDGQRQQVELPITAAMAPNAYVHITLLQPHTGKQNERPLRLYGIVPLEVADPKTYLKPLIEAKEEWRPQSQQFITVSEGSGREMHYTLAIVDEGLLGLTNHKTPNLHREFYVKEALGIKTWDLFDSVLGAYNGNLERMLAIGGGDGMDIDAEANRKRRFPPVVKVMGPFTLKPNESKRHEVTLPPYIGAVRAMVVAASKGAFGKTEQEIIVKQPLILQASLPRTLGTDETFDVPVSLFVTDESIKSVVISAKGDDFVEVLDGAGKAITFDKTGEQLGRVRLKTRNRVGKTRLLFTAIGGAHRSETEVFLDIRHPNTATTRSVSQRIEPGESWKHSLASYGLPGTHSAGIELSAVPAMNLARHLDSLTRYPHGCLEQTTSTAFPQLYLTRLMDVDKKRQESIQQHVTDAVGRMSRFQTAQGDFNYWPGAQMNNAWASVYAGHFLIEAKRAGYLVPPTMLSNWLLYQADASQRWALNTEANDSHTQAYRLYVLSLAGKPQMSPMNRLRESGDLSNKARWLLASAYQSAGQPAAASDVIKGLQPAVGVVKADNSFSSKLGDLGIRLENLVALGKDQDASMLVEEIAEILGKDQFHSTQGIAWALMGAARYLGDKPKFFTAKYTVDKAAAVDVSSEKAIYSQSLLTTDTAPVEVQNTSGIRLYANLITRGVPALGDERSVNKGLELSASFSDVGNKDADLGSLPNGSRVAQGTDVKMSVTVKNTTPNKADYLALTMPVPAGWELANDLETAKKSAAYQYREQRDDRVNYYFELKAGESKTFTVVANAAYLGRFYLPPVSAEAMYNGDLQARERGRWISVVDDVAPPKQVVVKTIKSKRAILHDGTSDAEATKMYVIAGDKVTVLSEAVDADGNAWLFVRFEGKKIIEKWIKADTVE